MWPEQVALMSPALDQDLGLERRIEELAIQKFGVEPLRKRTHRLGDFTAGVRRFTRGLAQNAAVGEGVGVAADPAFAERSHSFQ